MTTWRWGVVLKCGHSIELGESDFFPVDRNLKVRKDGWPAALKCSECGRRRAVRYTWLQRKGS